MKTLHHSKWTRGRVRVVAYGMLCAVGGIALLSGFGASEARTIDPNATLIVAVPSDPVNLDPRTNHTIVLTRPLFDVYEAFIAKNWFAGADSLRVVPGLAKSWTISKDKKTYTFELQRGVKFHDGTAFNAQALVFNMRVLFDPTFEYHYPEARATAQLRMPFLKSYRAIGANRFQLTLTQPDGALLERWGSTFEFFIVSPTAIRRYGNKGIADHPTGTGPFKFVSYQPGQQLVLERFDQYWRGPAKFKTLVQRFIPDVAARTTALEAKEVHVAENISVKNAERWRGRKDLRVEVRQTPGTQSCWFNFREGPTTRPKFREAVNLALNRRAMNAVVFDGKARPANAYAGPGAESYDPKLRLIPYDPALARTRLRESGVRTGTKLTILASLGNPNAQLQHQLAKEDLRRIGIEVDFQYLDQATWVQRLLKGVVPGEGPDGFCPQALGTDNTALIFDQIGIVGWPPKGFNAGFYRNAAVERAYKQAISASTFAEFMAAVRAANRAAALDYAHLYMLTDPKVYGVVGNVIYKASQARSHQYYSARVTKR